MQFQPSDLPRTMPRPRPIETPLGPSALAPDRSLRPRLRDTWDVPRLRWDTHPRGPRWSAAVMAALRGPGAPLLDVVPRDIAQWCPAYPTADAEQRAAFWAGLVSTLAWHESTHDPDAVGGDGRWFGLVQIAPGTAQWRNCQVGTGEALLDGPANLRCGIRIMAATVPRDGVIAEGMRGVAADWGPFHSTRKREDMRNWVRIQEYCRAQVRPVLRPEPRLDPTERMALRPQPRPVRPATQVAASR
ncbi:transglycosylase SLT domain-containing protein [Roseicyclus marinus]|nr:transglycosylase SLT domain-containing protein [Roseicyclus marinus]